MEYKMKEPRDVRLTETSGKILFALGKKTKLSYTVLIEEALILRQKKQA